MIFFLNATMQPQKSGIEHAQLKRADLFRAHGERFKIVLREWDPLLHENIKATSLKSFEVINMFDYFQEATEVSDQTITVDNLDFGVANTHRVEELKKNRYLIYDINQQLIARVNYRTDQKQVASTELFDGFGNLYCVNMYDSRGFVSLSQWYTPDNKIGSETWQSPEGRTVLEAFNKINSDGSVEKVCWRLMSRVGEIHIFDTLEQVTLHFLNLLNDEYWSKNEPNIFILDRAHLAQTVLRYLDKPSYSVLFLHNSHASDASHPEKGILNNNYEYSLFNINVYDAVVSATERQTNDIRSRFKPTTKLFTIPVGVIPMKQLQQQRVPMAERTFGKVVALARKAPEKQLDQLVKAVAYVRQQVPQITLDLYGYKDPTNNFLAERLIESAIRENNLENIVTLHDYTNQVALVEQDAQVFGVTSSMEGFNLSLMEALAQGDIGVTYDVNYGPNAIINEGKNGYIVPLNDYKSMGEALIHIFKEPRLMQQLSDTSYEMSYRYSSDTVWAQWCLLLVDAKKMWPVKQANYFHMTINDLKCADEESES
ncbi:glycosyl transferase family 1 [Leuconostoc mesenteroides subsp. dextranicum]|uniref:glycosyltransferase n=1 Tax=Leuconostoc mesenteroides TaxID=1245 RepID=UPI00067FC48D|nr:glycosyltransferase [Leuconostoc mesenteroides]KMY81559.1 glycosyl transferase family 1 [Leuconostoc mesenteroides subsp. dextranicum]